MPGDYYVNAIARGGGFGGGQFGGPWRTGRRRSRRRTRRARRSAAPARRDAVRGDDQEQVNYAPTYYPGVAVGQRGASRSRSASARKCSTSTSTCSWCASRASAGTSSTRTARRSTSGNVNLMPDSGRRPRQPDRHELRRPHPVGRRVHDQQRAAGPLHPARARRRQRDAAVRGAADQRRRRRSRRTSP